MPSEGVGPTALATLMGGIFRAEHGRCVAALTRQFGDLGVAEDAVAYAWEAAARLWPTQGVAANPGAWIMTTARRRALDHVRRESSRARRERHATNLWLAAADEAGQDDAGHDKAGHVEAGPAVSEQVAWPDDQLRLLFFCCHPSLAFDVQVALALSALGGLSNEQIARAFVLAPSTLAQRLVRARRKLRATRPRFAVPADAELPARLDAVLAVLYAVFNEGHVATAGVELGDPALARLAIDWARLVVELLPDALEAHGLLALFLLTEARREARTGAGGALVPLRDQDRRRWDVSMIEEGHAIVRRCLVANQPGPYQVQAAIAAVHADATHASDTDWLQIVTLYDLLYALSPTAVVALNRAIACGEANGAHAGLAALSALESDTDQLASYAAFHAARAEFLWRVGRRDDARVVWARAAGLTSNAVERAYLQGRAHGAAVERSCDST